MIQFNLLPDVKLEYIKARRMKRTLIMTSVLVTGASIALFVLLFSVVNFVQKQHMSNLDSDIAKAKNELKAKPDLVEILTIQNQLNSLPDLHNQKPAATRVFNYVQQITPQNVTISSFTVNFGEQTVKIEGSADSLATINTFTDTLKFTNYTVSDQESQQQTLAFNSVVLAGFTVSTDNVRDPTKVATYSITFKYDPAIFMSDKDVKLEVTKKITTRSETEKPSTVFQAKPSDSTQEVN